MSRYAISDIHGCLKTFQYMLEQELKLQPSDSLYLLGDYIDRGPDSKGVLDYIMGLQEQGFQVHCLLGNHEDMLLRALADKEAEVLWLLNGGERTLRSFQVTSAKHIPEKYIQFIKGTDYYFEVDDYLLVHAGFNFEEEDFLTDVEAMLWIRDFEVDKEALGNRRIIHGHTPRALDAIAKAFREPVADVLDIDGGCVFTKQLGYLIALNLDTLEVHALRNREEV
jgi:serine/threonine protein phosphatase 1